jgi:anti-sigma regulatory factor (Ser/Thr protein kinase)
MEDLSLHILDIAENSITAGADRIEIMIREDSTADLLILEVRDNGKGMDEELLRMVSDPFFTTKTVRKVGLGIPLLKQAAEESGGRLTISSEEGKGTIISAEFRPSHIDMKPIGDIGATIMVLIAGNPELTIVLEYNKDSRTFRFDTDDIKAELEGIPINLPLILERIKEGINRGIRELVEGSGR